MVKPLEPIETLNLNGSNGPTLIKALMSVRESIIEANEAIRLECPHGRDFPNGGYQEAREKHISILKHLEDALRLLDERTLNLVDQQREIDARKAGRS